MVISLVGQHEQGASGDRGVRPVGRATLGHGRYGGHPYERSIQVPSDSYVVAYVYVNNRPSCL
jgi:hypothetical protein